MVLSPAAGRSSGRVPFFQSAMDGGGLITAIGWSGQWAAKLERAKEGPLRLTAGMQTMHLKLSPGETIRSPRICNSIGLARTRGWLTTRFGE